MSQSWNQLYEISHEQLGYFTTQQARAVGLAPNSLYQKVKSGGILSIQHGIYRFNQYPITEEDDQMEIWLWSKKEGVFSHDTALEKYNISDVFPAKTHITLPTSHSKYRKIPSGVIVHFDDVPQKDIQWLGSLPFTKPERTIEDLARAKADPDIIEQAITKGVKKDMVALGGVLSALLYLVNSKKK